MKIYGQRRDGAILLSIGGGVGVIMRGAHASKPIDLETLVKLGPWTPTANDMSARLAAQKQLDKARVIPLPQFHLGLDSMSFDERRDRVYQALCTRLGIPSNGYGPMGGSGCYIPQNGLGEDWVVYCANGKHYGLGYEINANGGVMFDGVPSEVTQSWEEIGEAGYGGEVDLGTKFYANYMKAKKKLISDMPSSLPNANPVL